MRLYPADYLADTAHLSAMQHGIYFLLILNYWQRGGPLPNDDARLAKIARVSMRDWMRNRDEILDFFTLVDNHWCHGRISAELSHVTSKSLKSKEAAKASVQRRFGERSTGVEPTDTEADTEVTLAKANGAKGADSDKEFWDTAKSYLADEAKAPGGLIGKWAGQYGKQAVAQAITRAQLERPVQKIPFITGTLKTFGRASDEPRLGSLC
ncbi:DUF1376 domain-containing protein [Sphingomonas sp. LY29]|uniref:YdaU family protein n=1 Tax=Sphingomonas sp. LY29 TaxID=3095341 RepID=UPI002D768AB2|nr:DUF1376 domain-containing protein [Sphingomonas sp. LY29]WRP25637.1 DUF1376 domain-containing protein [Sphingomonas sp. LY29]